MRAASFTNNSRASRSRPSPGMIAPADSSSHVARARPPPAGRSLHCHRAARAPSSRPAHVISPPHLWRCIPAKIQGRRSPATIVENQCRISAVLQKQRHDRCADQNQNDRALKLSDEKRERRFDASFIAYPIFSKFGKPPAGFSACQTGSHSGECYSFRLRNCTLQKKCARSQTKNDVDRFASNSYTGQRSIGCPFAELCD